MIYKMIPFIIIALIIVFSAHFLIYFTLVRFFNVTSPLAKVIIFTVILALALSFIFASLWSHFSDSVSSRVIYLLAASWYGLLVNFILASFILWLLSSGAKFFGWHVNQLLTGVLFFTLATLWSIYGVWNAFTPQLKNITVAIKDLPASWQGKKIVQLSDVHLGHIYRVDYLEQVVEKVNDLKPDAVVITGDLFDGLDGNLNSFIQPLNNLQAPAGIFFVTGNHETYLGLDKALKVLKETKIKVLADEVVMVDGLQLIGLSYAGEGKSRDLKNIIANLKDYQAMHPSILLYHVPAGVASAQTAGVNLQLSGHSHRGQLFPFMFITYLVYGGHDYGLHILDDYAIYTTSGLGTWGPPMRTGSNSEIVVITLVSK